MHRYAKNAVSTLAILASTFVGACSDSTSPVPAPDARVTAPTLTPVQSSPAVSVEILSGRAADSALRARARAQSLRGDNELSRYLDTAVVWNSSAHRASLAASLLTPRTIPTVLPDFSGVGDAPSVIDGSYFPRPLITSSSVTANIDGATVTFASSMSHYGATSGVTDMTYYVKTKEGADLFPSTPAHFSEVAQGVSDCVGEIAAHPTAPYCLLWGNVTGMATVNTGTSCGFRGSIYATHNAALVLPIPFVSLGSARAWTVTFGWLHVADAFPVGNALKTADSPDCQTERRRVAITSDGGDYGGSWLIFQERQATSTCYGIQDRTVQADGTTGPWRTIGIECYSSAYASTTAGATPSAASGPTGVRQALQFTLAALDGAPGSSRAQIVRRGSGNAESQRDVIAITSAASADDLGDAIDQWLAKAGNTRSFNDAVENVGNSGKGKGAGSRRSNLEELLKEIRKARHSTVSGIGDAGVMPVFVVT